MIDFAVKDPRESKDDFDYLDPKGVSHRSVRAYVWNTLGLCGCYDDELHTHVFFILGKLWHARKTDDYFYYDHKSEHHLLHELILHILADKNLTEHGGSVRGSWLSQKGADLCELLEKDLRAAGLVAAEEEKVTQKIPPSFPYHCPHCDQDSLVHRFAPHCPRCGAITWSKQ